MFHKDQLLQIPIPVATLVDLRSTTMVVGEQFVATYLIQLMLTLFAVNLDIAELTDMEQLKI